MKKATFGIERCWIASFEYKPVFSVLIAFLVVLSACKASSINSPLTPRSTFFTTNESNSDNLHIIDRIRATVGDYNAPWWFHPAWALREYVVPSFIDYHRSVLVHEGSNASFAVDWYPKPIKEILQERAALVAAGGSDHRDIKVVVHMPGLGGHSGKTGVEKYVRTVSEAGYVVAVLNQRGHTSPLTSETPWSATLTDDLELLLRHIATASSTHHHATTVLRGGGGGGHTRRGTSLGEEVDITGTEFLSGMTVEDRARPHGSPSGSSDGATEGSGTNIRVFLSAVSASTNIVKKFLVKVSEDPSVLAALAPRLVGWPDVRGRLGEGDGGGGIAMPRAASIQLMGAFASCICYDYRANRAKLESTVLGRATSKVITEHYKNLVMRHEETRLFFDADLLAEIDGAVYLCSLAMTQFMATKSGNTYRCISTRRRTRLYTWSPVMEGTTPSTRVLCMDILRATRPPMVLHIRTPHALLWRTSVLWRSWWIEEGRM